MDTEKCRDENENELENYDTTPDNSESNMMLIYQTLNDKRIDVSKIIVMID